MLVGIALVFLDQEGALDAPAIAGAEVAAGMHIQSTEGAAGDSGVFVLFGHDLQGVGIECFPLFPAHHDMEVDGLIGVGSILVADCVYPLEVLPSLAPILSHAVFLLLMQQTVVLLPNAAHRAVLEHDHEVPVVGSATFHDRLVGIDPIEQQHQGQAGKCLLDVRGEAVKGLALAVLLALFAIARLVLEKLAHQGDNHAVAKAQAGLQHIDVVLIVLLLITVGIDFGSDSAL